MPAAARQASPASGKVVALRPKADPIFPLIRAYYSAYAPYSKIVNRWSEFPADVTRRPQAVVGLYREGGTEARRVPMYAYTEAQIDAHFDGIIETVLAAFGPGHMLDLTTTVQNKHRAEAKAALKADAEALRKRQMETGFTKVDRERDRLMCNCLRAQREMLRTKPTTIAGVQALAKLALRRLKSGEFSPDYDLEILLATLARA